MGCAGFNGAVEEVFADVVDYAGYFADLVVVRTIHQVDREGADRVLPQASYRVEHDWLAVGID